MIKMLRPNHTRKVLTDTVELFWTHFAMFAIGVVFGWVFI
jgi:hypothetical protein